MLFYVTFFMCQNMLKHTHSCRQTLLYSVVELESNDRNPLIFLELDAACPTKKCKMKTDKIP